MTVLAEEVMSQMLFNHDTEHTLRAVAVLINSDRVDGERLGDLAGGVMLDRDHDQILFHPQHFGQRQEEFSADSAPVMFDQIEI